MNQEGLKELIDVRFGEAATNRQITTDDMLTLWVPQNKTVEILKFLKGDIPQPFPFLFDLTAIDERSRQTTNGQTDFDFTLVYHLFSYERNSFIRIKQD